MTVKAYRVLFLCTGNSARSIMAEAVLNHVGAGRFRAFSAGSFPTGRINPHAIAVLEREGYPTGGLRSKGWDEFAGSGAPEMNAIITVCGNAAGEVCPVWPGQPVADHWGFADPAACQGSDDELRATFAEVFGQIRARIQAFMAQDRDRAAALRHG